MKHNSDKDKFSLKENIQKRKTQEIQRTILDQQIAKARGDSAMPPAKPAPPVRPQRPAKRASQELQSDKRATLVASSVRANRQRDRVRLIVGIAATLVLFTCAASLVLASNSASIPLPTPTFVPLPNVTAMNIVDYLGKVGLSAANLRQYDPQTDAWRAMEELEFNLQRGADKVEVIALSYPTSAAKMPDVFRAHSSSKFKTWQMLTVANMILLISPDSSPGLSQDLTSHVMQFTLAPYRSFWPTATAPAKAS